MAEEVIKTKRLQNVASELGIATSRVIDFLKTKGIVLENKPTAKISEEAYRVLLEEFQSDKIVKDKSQQVAIGVVRKPSVETIESEEPVKEEIKEEEDEGLIIRGTLVSQPVEAPVRLKHDKPTGPKVLGKIDLDEGKKKKKEDIDEKVVEVKKEPTKEKPKKSTKTSEAKKEIEPKAEVPPVVEEKEKKEEIYDDVKSKKLEPNIKILGKIDVDKKPKKREKSKEVEEVKEVIPPVDEEIPSAPVPEAIVPKTPVKDEPEEAENFLKTEYVNLKGPTILGKIELSTPKKEEKKLVHLPASASSSEADKQKKKRKRIKKGIEKVGDATQFQKDKPQEFQKNKDKPKEKERKFKHQPKEKKTELSEEEIQKQIKDTLARLSSTSSKSKASKYRRLKREHVNQQMQEEIEIQQSEKNIMRLTEFVTVSELATMMNVSVTQIISTCMTLGIMVSINQRLDAETIVIVAEEFGYKVEFTTSESEDTKEESEDEEEDLTPRPPIVTVMGHVDHGKTSLLDYIRKTNVIAGEAGGITQHIGAYSVKLENGKHITFLDTPGHEAFTAMRARGAKVTDIVIVVVAADDNVMPQTKEAISHAQAAGVPIIIAINKIDKPGANPDKIREELAQLNILVEEWGGKYQCQEISAKKGINIESLLDKVLLEAELLELRANAKKGGVGAIIESSLDKGRGYISTILVQNGNLKIGDYVLAGLHSGRVKAMYNERGVAVKEAGPATPVLILGLDGAPQAGDKFKVMEDEHEARSIALKRQQLQREQGFRTKKHVTLDEIGRRIAIGDFKELNIIIKGDVDGSVEALRDSFMKLSTEKIALNVIQATVGQVSESDVLLAAASNAIIIAFQVRPSVSARKLAEAEQIDIRMYSIIYDAINELKAAMEGMLSPEIVEKIVCNVEIREVFKISKVGTIAGCMVLDGKINRNTKIRVIRDGIVVYSGVLSSLKRFKDDVKEVVVGQDCGIGVHNYNDIKVGDIIEGYEETEVKAKL